jgi:tetratricopeptide (TPR) repeat protein
VAFPWNLAGKSNLPKEKKMLDRGIVNGDAIRILACCDARRWDLRVLLWLILAIFLPVNLAGAAVAGEVTVRETSIEIPSYLLGPEDENPPFHNPNALGAQAGEAPVYNQNVYPYAMQTGITGHRALKEYDAVVLENEFIRLTILPELGGRIYAAHDKTNEGFDFIYHNRVIKPSLVALRGAWISGGIEWNFPTRGHTTNTFSPVLHKIVEGDDGSVTCVVGTMEWVRRMKWAVGITVYPDRSCFRTRILLTNPTLTHNRAYFWANAAVHAWPDTRVIFPPADHTFAGMRRNPEPWPINRGKDVSWYKNTAFAHDFFCGVPGDYHGAYNVDRDCGTVHTSSGHESPGQKFWTWGTAPSGAIWEDLLTDDDGQYIEVQAGRLPTQGDTWLFEPHMQEHWDEYWYPVRGMKGFVKANAEAAVNLSLCDGKVFVAVNTTREYRDATLDLLADGRQVVSRKLTVSPRRPWQEEVSVAVEPEKLQLDLRDQSGRPIIAHSTRQEPLPSPDLEPKFPAEENASAEQTYLAGYYALKHWRIDRAEGLFEEALKKDSGFTPALRMLAILRYQAGDVEKAYERAEAVLDRNDDDYTARYYSALCRLKLGIAERTKDDLHLVGRRAAYRHVAPYLLASLAIAEGDLATAESLLRRAIRNNPSDVRARTILAAVLRNQGRDKDAKWVIKCVLADDPIDELVLFETALLGANDGEVMLTRQEPQYCIEAACAYLEMNLLGDAVRVLKLCHKQSDVRPHPFVDFYLGHLADRMGQPEDAKTSYERGLTVSTKSVFPFRTESLAVLQTGLRYAPENWKLHFYLGTLLTAKRRWQEGLEHFLAAEKSSPDCSVLYSNLGTIYWRKLNDVKKAQAAYERARELNPADYHYYVTLDVLYAQADEPAKRGVLFSQAPPEVESDFRVRFRRASYCCDEGRYDEALGILTRTTFTPWEGFTAVHGLYSRILNSRADEHLREGKYDAAVEDLRLAMEYPKNLGVGRPHDPDFGEEHFRLGLCYEAVGDKGVAVEYLTKAAGSGDSNWSQKAREVLNRLNESE